MESEEERLRVREELTARNIAITETLNEQREYSQTLERKLEGAELQLTNILTQIQEVSATAQEKYEDMYTSLTQKVE